MDRLFSLRVTHLRKFDLLGRVQGCCIQFCSVGRVLRNVLFCKIDKTTRCIIYSDSGGRSSLDDRNKRCMRVYNADYKLGLSILY